MDLLVKIFVMIGSGASIGFGVWHFFVPRLWMLAAFTLVSLCYVISLMITLAKIPMANI